jgi:Protein of unknown function (DUF3617)
MRRQLVMLAAGLVCTSAAFALDMPARKAGLWELKMHFDNRAVPPQTVRQCIDAATDKLMRSSFGGSPQQSCRHESVSRSGGALIVDSVCDFGGATTTSHAVITGDYSSAYTMHVTSTRRGGPAIPGMASGGESHVTIEAKWLGACAAGERPGDIIMGNGMKINVLDLRKRRGIPPPPHY